MDSTNGASSRTINLRFNNEEQSVVVNNNVIRKSLIDDYFPKGSNLKYCVNGQSFLLQREGDNICLASNVDTYIVVTPRVAPDSDEKLNPRKKKFMDMLDKINHTKDPDSKIAKKKKSDDQLIGCTIKKNSETKKSFLKRVVYVNWKHKKSPEASFEIKSNSIGGVKKIILNANEDYPLQTLKSVILEQYIDDINRLYFEGCDISIGTYDGQPITIYTDHDGDECDFWKYCNNKLRNSNHMLKLSILSVKVESNVSLSNSANVTSLTSPRQKNHPTNSSSNILQNQFTSNKENIANNILEKNFASRALNTFASQSSGLKVSQILQNPSTSVNKKESIVQNILKQNIPLRSVNTSASQSSGKACNSSGNTLKSSSLFSKLSSKPLLSPPKKECHKYNVHGKFQFKKPEIKCSYEKLNLSIKKIKVSDLQFTNITLGKGGQGVVMKGKYVGSEVAIKSMEKSSSDKLILREIVLLDKIRHPNIISIMAVSSTPTHFHIVMEFFDSISLFSLLFDAKKKTCAAKYMASKNNIAIQMCTAVAYLHLQATPIIHRDIKPSNILINEYGILKLCDLGLGKCSSLDINLQSSVEGSKRGTYFYMAPEILMSRGIANTSTDIWAIACTFIEMYSGRSVWQLKKPQSNFLFSLMEMFNKRKIPSVKSVPDFMQKAVLQCFSYNHEKRPNISTLLNLLQNEKSWEQSDW